VTYKGEISYQWSYRDNQTHEYFKVCSKIRHDFKIIHWVFLFCFNDTIQFVKDSEKLSNTNKNW
jgi:hypothetical protein